MNFSPSITCYAKDHILKCFNKSFNEINYLSINELIEITIIYLSKKTKKNLFIHLLMDFNKLKTYVWTSYTEGFMKRIYLARQTFKTAGNELKI
jgi:hypothetical protein